MKKMIKNTNLGSLTRAGLILNIIFCGLGILGYFIGAILQIVGIAVTSSDNYVIGIVIFGLIILIAMLALSIVSIIISIMVLQGKSNNILLAGILALFSGGLIAGILILVGNYTDHQQMNGGNKTEM